MAKTDKGVTPSLLDSLDGLDLAVLDAFRYVHDRLRQVVRIGIRSGEVLREHPLAKFEKLIDRLVDELQGTAAAETLLQRLIAARNHEIGRRHVSAETRR